MWKKAVKSTEMVSVWGPISHNDTPETIYFTAYHSKAVPWRKQAPTRAESNGVAEHMYPYQGGDLRRR